MLKFLFGLVWGTITAASPLIVLAADDAPLRLVAKIPLGSVSGRIDHMALDHDNQRLFVAELGNDTVGVIDLQKQSVAQRITGLSEPQGLAYVAQTRTLYVASAGDGSVRLYRGDNLSPSGKLDLKSDADNLRVDRAGDLVFAGFGSGAIAAIDAKNVTKTAEIRLKAHPEGFQLEPSGSRIFVNVPDAHEIAVLDRTRGQQVAAWTFPGVRSNFPMAARANELLVVFRSPARLLRVDTATGQPKANIQICGDADDVFVDERRLRAYISCGAGFLDVVDLAALETKIIGHVPTASGARTSFFDLQGDKLFLAVRATFSEPAAIWIYQPE